MTDREWIDAFAATLGEPAPADDEVEAMLALAGAAAHASARTAAPVACWMAAAAGRSPREALAAARAIAGSQG